MTPRRTTVLVFALLLLAAAALQPGYVDNVDSRIILRMAERLVDAGSWSLGDVEGTYMANAEYGARGVDGTVHAKFGPGNALLDIPFLLAGRALLGTLGLDAAHAGEAVVSMAPALWFAVAGTALLRILRRLVSDRAAMCGTLAWAFGTYAVVYGKSSYLELPLTAAVLLAHDAALSCRARRAAWGPAIALGAACAAVLWIKVAGVIWLAGLPFLLLAGRDGSPGLVVRTSLRAAVAFVPAAVALLALNHARFGHPLDTGYGPAAWFGHPLLGGLVYLLVSERSGLLVYAPLAFAGLFAIPALARRDRGIGAAVAVTTVASLVLHAVWCSPEGGDVWGPRYLLTTSALLAVPATVAAATAWARPAVRATAAFVVVAGAALNLAPLLVSFHEPYTLRGALGPLRVPHVPLTARVLREKVTGDGTYDLARLGIGEGTWTPPGVEAGLSLWPNRVAERAPRATKYAWVAWGALGAGAVVCAYRARPVSTVLPLQIGPGSLSRRSAMHTRRPPLPPQ